MPPPAVEPLEIAALSKIMDELDYYQLLNVVELVHDLGQQIGRAHV